MQELTIRFSKVAELVKALGKPLTVFDLETTTFRGRPNFSVMETACATITLQGNAVIHSHLINPEAGIDAKVSTLTGITQAMVRNKETWGQRYAGLFVQLARDHVVSGFNIKTFDCPAVLEMNERYGFPIETGFAAILDVRHLYLTLEKPESKRGNLLQVAAFYGVEPQGELHRAEADVILTLETLDAMTEGYGIPAILEAFNPKEPSRSPAVHASSKAPPRNSFVKLEQLVALLQRGEPTSVASLANAVGLDERTTSFELAKAIDDGHVNPLPLVNQQTLDWLRQELVETPTEMLAQGRLKPLYEHLRGKAPVGLDLDYLQLRIGMLDCGLRWSTLRTTS